MRFCILRIDGSISPLDNDLDVLRLGNFVNDSEVEVFVEAKAPLNVVLPPSSRTKTLTKKIWDEIEVDSCSDRDSGSSSCESMYETDFDDDNAEDDRMYDEFVDSEAEFVER